MDPGAMKSLLEVYGYLVLLPLAIMEGPIVTVIGGLLSSLQMMNPFIVYGIIVFGDIVGDAFWYSVGRFGRHWRFTKWIEKMFGITENRIEKLREQFTQHRYKMTLLAKVAYGLGSAGLVAAGVVRIPYLMFAITCLVISMTQAALFLTIGYLFGAAYEQIGQYLDYFATVVFVLSLFGIVFGIWYAKRKKNP